LKGRRRNPAGFHRWQKGIRTLRQSHKLTRKRGNCKRRREELTESLSYHVATGAFPLSGGGFDSRGKKTAPKGTERASNWGGAGLQTHNACCGGREVREQSLLSHSNEAGDHLVSEEVGCEGLDKSIWGNPPTCLQQKEKRKNRQLLAG